MRKRLFCLLALLALWAGAIGARLYRLQVVRHDDFRGRAERQQQRVIQLDPPRGTIRDARGRELAVSIAVESAFAVPRELGDAAAVARTARAVAGLTGLDAARLARQLTSDREFVWVARKLDPPEAQALRRLQLPGIYFLEESKRYYPLREVAAPVLGYVGTDDQGLAGLEAMFDKTVAGKPGRRTVLRDARRGTAVAPDLAIDEAEPGEDLELTLDAAIQNLAERELARVVEEWSAKSGSVVLMEPATGAIVALASYPGFDPNRFNLVPAEARRNRPVMDAYEPGSTFKLVTAAAALEGGFVDPDTVIDCGMGGITLLGVHIADHRPFGLLPFRDVIAKSSNIGTIKAALRVGNRPFYETIRTFGFGRQTGIDLPGESPGLLQPVERWGPLTKAYIAFGQGLSITPLQLAVAFAAVANGGAVVEPYIVAAAGRGTERRELHPVPVTRALAVSPATLRTLRQLLAGVVVDGTGKNAAILGYPVAGKTGTAQKAVAGGYSASEHIASFAGFAPLVRPALVGVVVIDAPRGGAYHGGDVAAPVFAAVVRQALLYRGVPPEREVPERWPGELSPEELEAARQAPLVAAATGGAPGAIVVPVAIAGPTLPDFAGQTARQAVAGSSGLGLRTRLAGQGIVVRQEPPPGTPLAASGGEVRLWLATGVS